MTRNTSLPLVGTSAWDPSEKVGGADTLNEAWSARWAAALTGAALPSSDGLCSRDGDAGEPCAGIPCQHIEVANRAQEGNGCSSLKEFLLAEIRQCEAEDEEDEEAGGEGNLCRAWDGWSHYGYVGLGKRSRESECIGAVLKRYNAMDGWHLLTTC